MARTSVFLKVRVIDSMKVKIGSEEEFINWKIVFNSLDGDFFSTGGELPPPPGDKILADQKYNFE